MDSRLNLLNLLRCEYYFFMETPKTVNWLQNEYCIFTVFQLQSATKIALIYDGVYANGFFNKY